ncbi:oligoribonuclease [Candidatus Nomurabacteria bacterium]|uniref:Oligoribonuclease n=1 Tax=Candidatus Dojkabacteria bacterium TaxID=2099670 RepID=A0A955KWY5_9BACT|nr:oligoribonuclease [Candidatus Dojkabacteria bacterium]MCB9790019.1 oligoribonuclease [Candidatus Nomurabacteria bacterium]MCB9803394.1 oligoribonuclease [Candidatus Nomurabacteria bacterium]
MTGVDPLVDRIIEIALLVTDLDLNIIDEKGFEKVITVDKEYIPRMETKVIEMHTQNGLLEESLRSTESLDQVQEQAVNYLSNYVEDGKSPLCGDGVTTDRAFLLTQARTLNSFFHHRTIDVSSFKQLTNFYKPDKKYIKPDVSHRALDDIRISIAELRYYKGLLFD